MAIVDMRRVSLLGMERDKHALLDAIQKLGCFQMIPADTSDANFSKPAATRELPELEDAVTRVTWAIGKLNKYDTVKKPFLGGPPSVTREEAEAVYAQRDSLMSAVEALERLESEAGELRGKAARLQARAEQLLPWRGFSLPLADVQATRNTVAMLGMAPKAALETAELPALCCVEPVGALRDQACVYVVIHRSCMEEATARLKELGFTAVTLDVEGTVADALAEQDAQRAQIDARQAEIIKETAAFAGDLPKLRILCDVLTSRRERLLAAKQLAVSERTFFLEGWVPAPRIDKVEQTLREASPSVCMEFREPAEGEEPPVLLRNNPVVSPFESIVSGFSLPAPGGLDPTAVMMPFFVNFMGMMISDAGYGLVLAILLPILIKVLKPAEGTKRMMWILTWGGVATVVWGALYNTWFGEGPFPSVFDPVNNSLPVMAVCIGLGAIHLFAGLGVAAYMNVKAGKPGSAIADQLSWFLLIVGLGLMLVAPQIGQWVAIAGAAIILCTAGREKSKNPFKRLVSGLGALYGITGWVSDLLSYMRLFGMGLATGVIGMVINKLIGMIFDIGPVGYIIGIPILIGGHLFNAAINILGAYVHSCRLQYIEFFGKFYEDGGKPFKPLAETHRYVSIKEAAQRT